MTTRSRRVVGVAAAVLTVAGGLLVPATSAEAASPCTAPVVNKVACENTKTGNPESEWEVDGSGDASIQGFATDISVNVGSTINFKIKTDARAYTADIYRIGWYGGLGARKVASITPSVSLPQNQPACMTDAATLLTDCGNWAVSASWQVPSTAVSGVYIVHLTRTDTGGDSQMVFIVRDDSSHSDVVYQTSDTTWQAYNSWGGASLYPGVNGQATKVSYNRPFNTRGSTPDGRDFFFYSEYPMVRYLEQNGYDVSYISGVDTDRAGSLLQNHKMFMSSGHDEYWSGRQRANVEAARDAGVNLAFFSGNESFWKTRYEASVDGSNTSYRTLVCYKETAANAKVDPTSTWTGTWRDPRFSPPADGGRPENGMTGTAYMSNTGGFAIQVPAAIGKMRFWRGTAVANQAAGAVATLAPNTLGYEFDADLDNGARPAGLFHVSEETENVDQLLQDYGTNVAPGTLTHNMTTYRAPSGALVFASGTVQWSWGLDADHDGDAGPTNVSMRQATVNILADMGAQPLTIASDLTTATASSDHTAPVSTITSPASGAVLASGSSVTVTGTATDSGGVVGGVEVSTDGGTTWHPATGRGAWTYKFTVTGSGAKTIKSRAVDDSGNIETPGAGVPTVTKCPCSIFAGLVPTVPADTDTGAIEVGVKFTSDVSGYVDGVRFYKGSGNTGTHTGTLWSSTGTPLATATFSNETASGWQQVLFSNPVSVTADTVYVVSYYAPSGHYAADAGFFTQSAYDAAPLHALKAGTLGGNGVYKAGSAGFPTATYQGANYYVDVVFDDTPPPDNNPPTVDAVSPVDGQTVVNPATSIKAQLSEAIQPATATWTVTTAGGSAVAGTASYDATTHVATFNPTATLATGTTYQVRLAGIKDTAGNVIAQASTWSFKTWTSAPASGACPCSIWSASATPDVNSTNDPGDIEVGVKFRTSQSGFITGLKFFKGAQNTGPHVATLWSSTGQQLATTTFSFESGSGWQQVMLSPPVAVVAGQTYVASYHTTTGYYASTSNGLGSSVVNGPLTALGNGVDGGNGVYTYGPRTFPTNSWASTNYWVDVVFNSPPDTTPPNVIAATPSDGAVRVALTAKVVATFNEDLTAGSAQLTLRAGSGGPALTGTVAYDNASRTVTFTPSAPLALQTTYTASLTGAADLAGNVMPDTSWQFTTSGTCPCTLFESDALPSVPSVNDSSPVELGVRFTPSTNGWITGVQFYKGPGNTGTHVGSLWQSSDGSLLGSATFTGESASGWQSVKFDQPVSVTAGTEYVVSYYAPNGHYSADSAFFQNAWDNGSLHAPAGANGVYAYGDSSLPTNTYNSTNYWVDVTFTSAAPADSTPPKVSSTSPVDGATTVATGATVRATFNEPIGAGATLSVAGPGGSVSGSTVYDATSRTLTFTPSSALATSTTYSAKVSGVVDTSGNAMADQTWSFTTAAAPTDTCPCTIWPDTATPATASVSDSSAVELGVKFRVDTAGLISGIRFYKGPQNTGTHTGSLWTSSGSLLATATFAGESASGWQTVSFSQPVAVNAATTYIASYHTTKGRYAADPGGFHNAGVDRGVLHALQSGVDGPNGVYIYGASAFPTNGSDTNYWVDVVYAGAGTDTTPPTITGVAASGSGVTATVTWTTDELSTSRVDYGTSSSSLTLSATTPGTDTAHSVALTGLAPNTRYWYRVSSVDALGNGAVFPVPSANPAQYAPPVSPIVQTSVADFAGGTAASTYKSDGAGGEIVLSPTIGSEFAGTTLPTGWTSQTLATGGKATVGSNVLTVDGDAVTTSTTYSRPRSVEFATTFTTAAGQAVGFGTTATSAPWAVFRTRNGNELVASSQFLGSPTETVLSPSLLGAKHTFRIDWVGSTITYRVDGVVVATHTLAIVTAMRAVISDTTVGGSTLAVDWLRVSTYAATGTFTSTVMDAAATVSWTSAAWTASVPAAGGTVAVEVRTGNTSVPDGTWSAYKTVAASGGTIGTLGRYAQVRFTLTSSTDRLWTPMVSDVTLTYAIP